MLLEKCQLTLRNGATGKFSSNSTIDPAVNRRSKKILQSYLSEDLENSSPSRKKRQLGGLKGFVTYIAEDFDAPIEDMKPYMGE